MNVTPRPEQERVVGEAISAGLIGNAEEVVDLGIETIRQRLELGASAMSFGLHRGQTTILLR